MSYLTKLKAGLTLALRKTFDAFYPDEKLRSLYVSIEYPIEKQQYPSIWVNFEETALHTSGVSHLEIDEDGNRILRWSYSGSVSYTIAALSSLERDLIFDELIRVIAFGRADDARNAFREYVEDNSLIAMNFNFDEVEVHGDAATPGTPWDTDEIIYERTVVMEVIGEFTTDVDTGNLVPLSKIIIDSRTAPSTESDPIDPMHWDIPRVTPETTEWH
jgi:hypothetical protein